MDQRNIPLEDIFCITRQFLACVPLKDFHWKIQDSQWEELSKEFQSELLKSTLFNPLLAKHPISDGYKKTFLKHLLNKLTCSGGEAIEEIYEEFARLIQIQSFQQDYCNRIYYLAARVLTEWCLENVQQFQHKNVLELGCGLGLTGIAVCKSCPLTSYTFTDCHPKVLEVLKHNININLLEWNDDDLQGHNREVNVEDFEWNSLKIKVIPFHWDDDLTLNELQHSVTPDIILAADVIYDIGVIPYLVKILKFFLQKPADDSKRNQPIAYIASTIRNPVTLEAFHNVAEMNGLKYEHVPFSTTTFFYDKSSEFQVLKLSFENS